MKKLLLLTAIFCALNLSAQQEPIKIIHKNERRAIRQQQRFTKVSEDRKVFGCVVEIDVNDIDLRRKVFIFNPRVIKKRHYKFVVNPERIGFGYEYQRLDKIKKE